VNSPRLNPSRQDGSLVLDLPTRLPRRGWKAELTLSWPRLPGNAPAESNSWSEDHESDALTTRLPSHPLESSNRESPVRLPTVDSMAVSTRCMVPIISLNNTQDNLYGVVITTQSHCESSPGSRVGCRTAAPGGRRPLGQAEQLDP